MSTHNIGFYEDLTKIIFELSSNIIKYAPYFFCCTQMSAEYLYSRPDNMGFWIMTERSMILLFHH